MLNDMRVMGLICECNPFHKGHKKIINEAKKHSDVLVAVMSGNYVQRGEPAISDKYERTKSLLKNGADIVIELPVEFAISSAKNFATAGISILNSLGFVDDVIFGSEINNLEKLNEYSEKSRNKNSDSLRLYYKNNSISKTYNYARAMENIIGKKLSPNDILAIEYLNAIKDLKSNINPIAIKRDNNLPSASDLRSKMKKKIDCNSFTTILNYKIIKELIENDGALKNIYCMNDDIYNAIINTASKSLSFNERAKLLNTKNRTEAYIKRLFFNIIFDIKKDSVKSTIPVIHILGLSNVGISLLKDIKVPYLLSYTPSAFNNLIKHFPKCKSVKLNKKGEYILSDSIKTNIFASNLYYNLSNINILEQRVNFLKFTK